jgi:hypothetical protein
VFFCLGWRNPELFLPDEFLEVFFLCMFILHPSARPLPTTLVVPERPQQQLQPLQAGAPEPLGSLAPAVFVDQPPGGGAAQG